MRYANEEAFRRHICGCRTREELLSDETYLMMLVGSRGAPIWRIEPVIREAVQRFGMQEEAVERWLAQVENRWQGDQTTFQQNVLRQREALRVISARDLQEKELPPATHVVEGLLSTGLAMVAARPKLGKSWMVLDLCLAVAEGTPFLGYPTRQGSCLYLALEDTQRRLQARLEKLLDGRPAPEGFYCSTTAHRVDEGLIEELEAFLNTCPDTRLIVIDTLQKVRGAGSARENAYSADYQAVTPLKVFADGNNLCMLLVHHLRKMGDEGDPFNRISGTNGILGALDTSLVLDKERRSDERTRLSVTGRDVENQEKDLRFDTDTCRWVLEGDAAVRRAREAEAAYRANPVATAIRSLVQSAPDRSWSGTMSELLEQGRQHNGAPIASNARSLAAEVKKVEQQLAQYDYIVREPFSHGRKGGTRYRFFIKSPGSDTTLPTLPMLHRGQKESISEYQIELDEAYFDALLQDEPPVMEDEMPYEYE